MTRATLKVDRWLAAAMAATFITRAALVRKTGIDLRDLDDMLDGKPASAEAVASIAKATGYPLFQTITFEPLDEAA